MIISLSAPKKNLLLRISKHTPQKFYEIDPIRVTTLLKNLGDIPTEDPEIEPATSPKSRKHKSKPMAVNDPTLTPPKKRRT